MQGQGRIAAKDDFELRGHFAIDALASVEFDGEVLARLFERRGNKPHQLSAFTERKAPAEIRHLQSRKR